MAPFLSRARTPEADAVWATVEAVAAKATERDRAIARRAAEATVRRIVANRGKPWNPDEPIEDLFR